MIRFLTVSLLFLSLTAGAQTQLYQTSTEKIRESGGLFFLRQAERDLIKAAKSSAVLLGSWNPATNTPALTASAASIAVGGYYVVNVAGNPTFGGTNFSTSTTFEIGDQLAKVGAQWTRLLASIPDAVVTQTKLANGAVVLDKVANGAIAPQKTTFLLPGKNLFNKADPDFVAGQYIEPDGSFHTLNGFNTSGYIPVLSSVAYTPSEKQHVVYYDAGRVRIGGDPASRSNATFTTPAGCAYVRCTLTNPDLFQLEAGSGTSAYEPYALRLAGLLDPKADAVDQQGYTLAQLAPAVDVSPNLFNENDPNVVSNKYLSDLTGQFADFNSFRVSGWIPVLSGRSYTPSKKDQIAFYAEKSLGSFIYTPNTGGSRPSATVTAPAGAYYMRCTIAPSQQFMIVEGSSLPASYVPYYTARPRLPAALAQKSFVSAGNETNPQFTETAKKALTAIEALELTVPASLSAHTWAISLLTRTTTTLSHVFDYKVQLIDENTGTQYNIVPSRLPSNTVERIPISTSGVTGAIILNWSVLPEQFELWSNGRIYLNVNVASQIPLTYPASQWIGKTVLWLGTSIPHLGLYPTLACEAVGANCINQAQSSSMVRFGNADGSWTGLPWPNVGFALVHTLAQKDSLINNWATIRTTLTADPPATLSDDMKALFRSCSYEARLMPYVNGTLPAPALIIFDHGHNDNLVSDSDAQFTQVPTNSRNKNTFIGSVNFIIDKILAANPRQRIAFVGHYDNQVPGKQRIAVAQQNLATYWEFPILKLWEQTGFSQQKVVGSKSLWGQAPYNQYSAGQDTAQDMTMLRVAMPDDLHPHSDPSGRTQAKLGQIVGKFLSQIF